MELSSSTREPVYLFCTEQGSEYVYISTNPDAYHDSFKLYFGVGASMREIPNSDA